MADNSNQNQGQSPKQTTPTTVQYSDGTVGHIAPNKKSAVLTEVEDDARYAAEKRFKEHYEEQDREAEKAARDNKPK